MNTPAKPARYSTPVTVEFEDVDSFQIAHHTKLVAYLERARVRYFHDKGVNVVGGNALPVLYHLDVTFKKTVTIMDLLDIQVWVEKAETYKLSLAYHIFRKGELIAKASTVIAFIDAQTQKLTPVPRAFCEE